MGHGLVATHRHHQGRSRYRNAYDPAGNSEYLAHALFGQYVLGTACRVNAAAGHGDEMIGITRSEIQVVEDHDNSGPTAAVQVDQQIEHVNLVRYVQEGRGFVQEKKVRFLRKRHGDPDPLPLAAGKRVDVAVGQIAGAGGSERVGDGTIVLCSPAREEAVMRMPPPPHEIGDCDPVGGDWRSALAERGGQARR